MKKLLLSVAVLGALSATAISCDSAKEVAGALITASSQKELAGNWELNYISGPRIAFNGLFPKAKPTMVFDVANKKVTGNGGCNGFNTTYTLEGKNLSFGPIRSTMMACENMKGEALFTQTLEQVKSFKMENGELALLGADNVQLMKFNKVLIKR